MSSSSAPTEHITTTPPIGWSNERIGILKNHYWVGNHSDMKDTLSKAFGLHNANPIWIKFLSYAHNTCIFRAEASPGKSSYYCTDELTGVVCYIDASGIDEIRESINKPGMQRGFLGDLKLVKVEPI